MKQNKTATKKQRANSFPPPHSQILPKKFSELNYKEQLFLTRHLLIDLVLHMQQCTAMNAVYFTEKELIEFTIPELIGACVRCVSR